MRSSPPTCRTISARRAAISASVIFTLILSAMSSNKTEITWKRTALTFNSAPVARVKPVVSTLLRSSIISLTVPCKVFKGISVLPTVAAEF